MKKYTSYPKKPKTGKLKTGKIYQSTRKNKKLMVRVVEGNKDKIVHFGQKGYKDYTQHKNRQRRQNYLNRSAGIRNKQGRLTKNNKFSANYWARRVLW